MAKDQYEDLMGQAGFTPAGKEPEIVPDASKEADKGSKEGVEEKKEDTTQQDKTPEAGEDKPVEGKTEGEKTPSQLQGEQQAQPAKPDEQTGGEATEPVKIGEQDILSSINNTLETKFSSLNDIKSLLGYKDKVGQFEEAVSKYKAQIQEKDALIEQLGNPYSVFSDQSVLRANELISKNTGMSPRVAFDIATRNFDSMSDDEVLILSKKLENPKLDTQSDSIILDKIDDEYRLNDYEDEEELTEAQQSRLDKRKAQKKSDADLARQELKALSDIKTPEQTKREEERAKELEEKAKQFQPIANEILENELEKIVVGDKEKFEFVIDSAFKDLLREGEKLIQYLVANYDPNDPNSRAQVIANLKNIYRTNQMNRIVDTVAETVRTRMQEEADKEIHNPKDKLLQEAPESTDVETKNKEAEERLLQKVR